ncbi:hypothetical protein [Deinococcus petrolearius]|uniref:Head decoration protein n=1 Tax=Deinococcus petrolearius TaxID=1751295 RepID=A0ABW1DEM3_9DEIO
MTTTTQVLGVARRFVADERTAQSYGLGTSVDFTKFTDAKYAQEDGSKIVPAGTVVALDAAGKVVPPVTTAGSESKEVYVLKADAWSRNLQGGSKGHVGLFSAGGLYENYLPDAVGGALPAALRTLVLKRFTLQAHPSGFVTT